MRFFLLIPEAFKFYPFSLCVFRVTFFLICLLYDDFSFLMEWSPHSLLWTPRLISLLQGFLRAMKGVFFSPPFMHNVASGFVCSSVFLWSIRNWPQLEMGCWMGTQMLLVVVRNFSGSWLVCIAPGHIGRDHCNLLFVVLLSSEGESAGVVFMAFGLLW